MNVVDAIFERDEDTLNTLAATAARVRRLDGDHIRSQIVFPSLLSAFAEMAWQDLEGGNLVGKVRVLRRTLHHRPQMDRLLQPAVCHQGTPAPVPGKEPDVLSAAHEATNHNEVEEREGEVIMRGSILKRSKGSYTLVIPITDPVTGKVKQKWISVKGKREKAEEELARHVNDVNHGAFVQPVKLTVSAFLDK